MVAGVPFTLLILWRLVSSCQVWEESRGAFRRKAGLSSPGERPAGGEQLGLSSAGEQPGGEKRPGLLEKA